MTSGRRATDGYRDVMAPSGRAIERVGFDRFAFGSVQVGRKGASQQRGTDSAGDVLVVGAIAWPEMPIDWLALSSRRGPDYLELDVGEPPVVDPDLAERFIIDTDVDDVTDLLDEEVGSWIISTDDRVGPIYVVLDGPDPDEAHTPTLFIARLELEGPDMLDLGELAREALAAFTSRG